MVLWFICFNFFAGLIHLFHAFPLQPKVSYAYLLDLIYVTLSNLTELILCNCYLQSKCMPYLLWCRMKFPAKIQYLLLLWLLAQAKWSMNSTTYLWVPEVVQNQMHTIQRAQRRCQGHCCLLSNNEVLYRSMAEPIPLTVQLKWLEPPLRLRGHILIWEAFWYWYFVIMWS